MTEDTQLSRTEAPGASAAPDASDPATSGPMGADLDELSSLDGPGARGSLTGEDAARDGDPSIRERQDPEHVGVDWDLTARTRD